MNLCSFRFDVNVKALFQVSSGHKNLSIKDPDKLISDLFFSCFCCSHSRFNLEKRGVSSACWSAVTRRNDLTPHLFTSSALLHQDRTQSVSHKSIAFWICTESCPRAMYSLSNCLNTFSGICRTSCSSDILKPGCRVSYPWGCCPSLSSTRSQLFFPH